MFTMKKKNEISLRVDDTKKTIKKNEEIMLKRLMRHYRSEETLLDTIKLDGPGSEKLIDVFGGRDDFFNVMSEIEVSDFYKIRYNLEEGTLQDLFDNVPLYSAVHIDVTRIENGLLMEYHIVLIKESKETTKELASFRVPKVTFKLSELIDPSLR